MSESIEIGILAYIKALEDRLSQVISDANYIVSNHNQGASILECNEQDLLQDMTSNTVLAKRPKILEDLLERKLSHDSNVSQDVNSEHHAFEKPAFWEEFERWWETHGQYCRAGGGDYEKSFAWAAFEYLKAQSLISQSEQQEVVATYRVQVVRDDGSPNGKPHYKDTKEALERDLRYLHDDNYKTVVTPLFASQPKQTISIERETLIKSTLVEADHLALSAENLLKSINDVFVATEALDMAGIGDIRAEDRANMKLEDAKEKQSDYWRAVTSSIYEYRKRAERVKESLAQ